MGVSSTDPVTMVPGFVEYDDRTWIGTWWRRACLTHRSISTFAPHAAISSISSKVTVSRHKCVGHDARVGGEDTVDVGVDLADIGTQRRGECNGGGVRTTRPSVVTSLLSWLTPWNPATRTI